MANGRRYNLLNSAIIEIFEYIKTVRKLLFVLALYKIVHQQPNLGLAKATAASFPGHLRFIPMLL